MTSFQYDNSEFTAISVLTCVSLFFSSLMIIANIIRHATAKYTSVRKRAIILIFINMQIIAVLLFIALWVYKGAEAFYLVVLILISTNLILYYVYVKETLTRYMAKCLKDNPHLAKELITREDIRKYMTEKEYPMDKVICCDRMKLQDYHVACCYLLETKARFCICCNIKISNFDKAVRFQRCNSLLLGIYIASVPIVQFIEYMLQVSNSLQSGNFSGKYLTRIYIIIFTFVAIIFIQSIVLSFRTILPFVNFKIEMPVILGLQALFNIIGFIVRVSSPEFSVYSQFESYQLVFVVVFSGIFTVFCIFQTILINPTTIFKSEQKSIILPKGSNRVDTTENISKIKEEYKESDHSYDKSGAENISDVGFGGNKRPPLSSTIKGVAV